MNQVPVRDRLLIRLAPAPVEKPQPVLYRGDPCYLQTRAEKRLNDLSLIQKVCRHLRREMEREMNALYAIAKDARRIDRAEKKGPVYYRLCVRADNLFAAVAHRAVNHMVRKTSERFEDAQEEKLLSTEQRLEIAGRLRSLTILERKLSDEFRREATIKMGSEALNKANQCHYRLNRCLPPR